ncbi:MAG: radical SAM protein [Acidobacteriota bacterium]
MRYKDLMAETWSRNILFSVMLELTYSCNLECFYCYNDVNATGRRMELQDSLRFLREAQELGMMNLTLSGGEPLASPIFFDLGRAARDMGLVIRVKTNGHSLESATALRIKSEIDPFNLDISLHGANAESHDRQTRVPGSFERLMQNLRAMQEAGLRLKLNAVLTSWNENEFEGMYHLADDLGLSLQMSPLVSARDDGNLGPLTIAPSFQGVERLLAFQKKRRPTAKKADSGTGGDCEGDGPQLKQHCGAGASSVTVDPFGNVLPCVQWRQPLGNLHQQSIREIWATSPRLAEVRQITTDLKKTVEEIGAKADSVGFCPALAEQLEGTPLTFDKASWERLKILRNLDEAKHN